MKKLSIIIPVFNEEKTIVEVIKRVAEAKIPNFTKEIIVVDDGSTDSSKFKILASRRSHAKGGRSRQNSKLVGVKLFSHSKNMGKGVAVRTGFENATGDYILIQDADLEYNPKDISQLLDPIFEGKAQVVYGTRINRLPNLSKDEKTPLFLLHFLGNRFLSFICSILYGQWITDMETGYKVFPKFVLKNIKLYAKSFDFEPEITAKLLKNKYKILEVTISNNPRGYNEGKKLNTFKDGFIALWSLLKYRFVD